MRKNSSKIYDRNVLQNLLKPLKAQGKKIGFTNGTFDILHPGHISYLEAAKQKCDILIVSINTDTSVKEYKNSNRPFQSEKDRAMVVAALESVDFVTFHNERRMQKTLEILKPDYYIKGGDYKEEELTSRDVLKQWGGVVILLPLIFGKSTSTIIQKIQIQDNEIPYSFSLSLSEKKRAVILDRDGVINKEVEYLHEAEKFEFVNGALNGIKKMQDLGFLIVIVTTQAGIGLGYFTKEDFFKVNKVMLQGMHNHGITVSKIYFCPHSLQDNCDCRKPKTTLFEKAKEDLHLDFSKTWVIGDKTTDIEAGKRVGAKTILVTTGHGGKDAHFDTESTYVVSNLLEAAKRIQKSTT